MGFWIIKYCCANGFSGEEIVPAVNKVAAWSMFEDISKNYVSPVIAADCVRVKEESEEE